MADARKLTKVKNHPGIYKREGHYVVVARDARGRQRKRVVGTLAAARAAKADMVAAAARGEDKTRSRETFAAYAETWVEEYAGRTKKGIRPATLAEYKAELERSAIPFLGKMRLAEIEPRDLRSYLRHVEKTRGRKGEPATMGTIRNALAPVRALFATAVEDGLLIRNPASNLRYRPKVVTQIDPDEQDERIKALTPAELAKLLSKVPVEHRLFVEFLAATGLRISEAIGLRWQHLALDKCAVKRSCPIKGPHLHVVRRIYQGQAGAPKSDFGRRAIPLSPRMAARLHERKKSAEYATATHPVFPSKDGTPLDPSNFYKRVFKPAAKAAGLEWAGFHTLRHTCASWLFRPVAQGGAAANAVQVQRWLGHHSAAFTLATYVHLFPEDLPGAHVFDALIAPDGATVGATAPAEIEGDRAADEAA